jgi:hypothetical protein
VRRFRYLELGNDGGVPGASDEARRVKHLNANWIAGADGEDGRFDVQIITSDDEVHILRPSLAAMTALIAITQGDTVLVWDPPNRALIAANLVGTMPWTERIQAQS